MPFKAHNGAGYDKVIILVSCLTSTDDTDIKGIYYSYPNPFSEELIIPPNDHLSLMGI